MQFVHPQQLLAQADIAVHGGHFFMDGFDQIFIDGNRNIAAVQRCFQSGSVLSGIGEEFQLLILGVQGRRGGVAEIAEAVVEVFVGALAQDPVLAFLHHHKGTLGQRVGLTLGVHRVLEFQVGIRQGTVNGVRGLGHFSGGCQQFFFRCRQCVGLSAAQVRQITAVALQLGALGIKAFQRLIGNRHDLRSVKAARGAQFHHGAHEFTLHGLAVGVPGVLVGAAHAVIAQPVRLHVHFFRLFQIPAEGFPVLAQFPHKAFQLLTVLSQG